MYHSALAATSVTRSCTWDSPVIGPATGRPGAPSPVVMRPTRRSARGGDGHHDGRRLGPAVDLEHLAGHPRRGVGGQVEDRTGDVLGLARSAEGRAGQELPAQVVVGQHDLEGAGGHSADVEGVDPDPRCELRGHVARHPVQGGLGRPVGDEHRLGHRGRPRRDVDHRPPPDGVHHLAGGQLDQGQGRGHVEGEGAGHEPLAGVEGGPRHGPTGIVDEDVEPAELLDRPADQPAALGLDHHVGRHDQGPTPEGPDPAGHLLEVTLGPGGQDHVGAGLGQADGDAAADPEAGPGHHGHASAEVEAVEDHRGPAVGRAAPARGRRSVGRWCMAVVLRFGCGPGGSHDATAPAAAPGRHHGGGVPGGPAPDRPPPVRRADDRHADGRVRVRVGPAGTDGRS